MKPDSQRHTAEPTTLLVVDDESAILRAFEWAFQKDNFRVLKAGTAADGLKLITEYRPDVVVLDVNLPDLSGLDLFKRIRIFDARIPVVFITGRGSTDTAIEATKLGAINYLFKPLDLPNLREVIHAAVEAGRRMRVPAVVHGEASSDEDQADVLVGRCVAMNEVYRQIGRIAPLDDPVLILGESGTGKELVARAIWQHSSRSKAPFMAVNCAAIPSALLESELFGHEQGAFTGADRLRIGKFEQCSSGTLFLDEIGDLAPEAQAKILRVLQEQEFERVGGSSTIQADVRVIAATNRLLESMIPKGEFRSDLFYRLSVFSIQLPLLKDREGDLPLLVEHFLKRFTLAVGKQVTGVDEQAMSLLHQYSWPGNLRELQSVLKQALLSAVGSSIGIQDLPATVRGDLAVVDRASPESESDYFDLDHWESLIDTELNPNAENLYRHLLAPVERYLILRVLKYTEGNQNRAAQLLGITRSTLRTKIRSFGIDVKKIGRSKFDHA